MGKVLNIFTIFCLYLLSIASLVYYHENAHQQIYAQYHVDSEIKYGILMQYGWTVPEENSTCPESCHALQAENEIYGYNLQSLVICAWALTLSIIIFRKDKEDKRRKRK